MRNCTRNNYIAVLFATTVLGASAPALGQQTPGSDESASEINEPASSEASGGGIVGDTGEGLGPNEISLGNAIQSVCPRLVGRLKSGEKRSAGEVDLQRRCTEVAQARSKNVSGTELNNILRELNVDEAGAQNRGLVELASIRSTAVIGRLQQLRLADAGDGIDEAIAYQSGPGAWNYHFETGGAAGDGDFGRWSVYLNGELFSGDRDQTALEAGFDLNGGRITVGGDYRVNNNTFVGASVDYVTSSADFDNDSGLDADGINATLYGTTYSEGGLYFDGTVGLGTTDYEQDRRFQYSIPAPPPPVGTGPGITVIDKVASADTDGNEFFLSAGVGKDIDAGNGMVANLAANLSYIDASIDGYTETVSGGGPGSGMGLRVRGQDIESLRSTVGGQISKAISTQGGVVIPFVRADWVHEFENDSRTIVASFANDTVFGTPTTFGLTTEEPDEDYFRVGGGVSAVFTGGLQGFVSLESVFGLSDLSYYAFTAGIRKEL